MASHGCAEELVTFFPGSDLTEKILTCHLVERERERERELLSEEYMKARVLLPLPETDPTKDHHHKQKWKSGGPFMESPHNYASFRLGSSLKEQRTYCYWSC